MEVLFLIIDKLNDKLNSNDHQSTAYIISMYVKKILIKYIK